MYALPALLVWSTLSYGGQPPPTALAITGRVDLTPKMLRLGTLWVSACGSTVAPDETQAFKLTTTSSPCVIEAWIQLPNGKVAMGRGKYIGLGPPNGPLGPNIDGLVLVGPGKRDIRDLVEEAAGRGRSVATLEAACAADNPACLEPLLVAWKAQYNWTLEMLSLSVGPSWSPL